MDEAGCFKVIAFGLCSSVRNLGFERFCSRHRLLEIGSLLKKVTGSRYISDGKVDVFQFHNLLPSLNIA